MNLEIERKFLVKSTVFKQEATQKKYIKQGFLNKDPNRTVRVRILDDCGYLTIKGLSNKSGTTRFEWEKEISRVDAENLFLLAEVGIVEKFRYFVKSKEHTFEVDEFLGDNQGLIIAEIELNSEDEVFIKPDWLGPEVTGEPKYYNTVLSNNPFKNWAQKNLE
ncbi:CYTH domain-containing protein [Polaribacter pacificus]|uniref:CYTH domain-containing protein n=1 Tax=Polaribacter pacificus TaxID=1775173 RepID=A0A917HW52_9FLAO|nr:CYTH domain-containing protein [Polaribacter pacificus]GGG93442.1 CYTH domain-containing protein [Polaribacter pacificus]